MTKSEIQQKAVDMMKETPLLILQWCTSLGKSKAAIDIIKSLYSPKTAFDAAWDGEDVSVLLVVAEIAHKKNWKEEFDKFNASFEWNNFITVETYASLKKYKGSKFNMIIFDEGHHAGSDLRMEILEEIETDKVLVLSATLPLETWTKFGLLYGRIKMSSYRITLQEAIDWGILPEPKIYCIPMELDNTNLTQIIVEERGRSAKRQTIRCNITEKWVYLKDKEKYPDLKLEIPCTELQKYIHLSDKIDFWKKQFFRTRNEGIKNKWMQYGSERKRYLGSLKDNKAKEVLKLIKKKRFVCFCSSIEQADNLGKSNSIHSKKKGALDTIDSFNSKEINNLFAVGMIQEGQNLVDIDAGVIIQLDGQERAFIQKSGRAMRAEEPILFILYFKNTRDEEYLQGALLDINPDYVTEVINIKDIKI